MMFYSVYYLYNTYGVLSALLVSVRLLLFYAKLKSILANISYVVVDDSLRFKFGNFVGEFGYLNYIYVLYFFFLSRILKYIWFFIIITNNSFFWRVTSWL